MIAQIGNIDKTTGLLSGIIVIGSLKGLMKPDLMKSELMKQELMKQELMKPE